MRNHLKNGRVWQKITSIYLIIMWIKASNVGGNISQAEKMRKRKMQKGIDKVKKSVYNK